MNSNHKMNSVVLTALVIGTTLVAGCASGPTKVEDDFGNSVRAMNRAQTLDPVAAAAPDTTPIMSTDGQRMENALRTYRDSVGDPATIKDDFDFQVSEE